MTMMLKEEQVHALLELCETVVGVPLKQIRGNLTDPVNRSAAIFELLAIQEFSELGRVEYEPFANSPDIRLVLPNGEAVWIEVAFLHEKYWAEERLTRDVSEALRKHAHKLGIDPHTLWFTFEGNASKAGYKRELPRQHELKSFVREDFSKAVFDRIKAAPDVGFESAHPRYTLIISYKPCSAYAGGGGTVQEAPREPQFHQLYRVVKQKAKQHSVEGMRLVCIGTDQSNALSEMVAPGVVSARDAVRDP